MFGKRVIFLVVFVVLLAVLFGLVAYNPLGLTRALIAPPPLTSQSSTPATLTPSPSLVTPFLVVLVVRVDCLEGSNRGPRRWIELSAHASPT